MGMKRRKLPERTCVGCRTVRPKMEMVRVVRQPDGTVDLDTGGKMPGRGAYVCPDAKCLDEAVKRKALDRALRVPVDPDVLARLRERLSVSS